MSEAQHDLVHELPEYAEQIRRLKTEEDGRFARLAGEYHEVVKELHQIEAGVETPEDAYVEQLKKQRLALKDDLAALLRDA